MALAVCLPRKAPFAILQGLVQRRRRGGAPEKKEPVMGLSAQHVLLLLIVALLLFGRGKISELMGDVAKGIKSFKKGMAEDEDVARPIPPRTIDNDASNADRTKTG